MYLSMRDARRLGISVDFGPIGVDIPTSGGGGIIRDPSLLCPGTPPIVADLTTAFRRDASLFAEVSQDMARVFAGEKDLRVAQTKSGTPDGLAQAVTWLAWGGADCKVGGKEPPIQARLIRIAEDERARQVGGSTPGPLDFPLPAGLRTGPSVPLLLAVGVVVFSLLRRGG